MIKLFNTDSLSDSGEMKEGYPWEFKPTAEQEYIATLSKSKRREAVLKPGAWNVYSVVRGVSRLARVSKENPPAALRGIVADYDAPTGEAEVARIMAYKIKQAEFFPHWMEKTLSGNWRLLWLFERELLVPDEEFCRRMIEECLKTFQATNLLSSYDQKSAEPQQVWTNGTEWKPVNKIPLSWDMVFGIACKVSSAVDRGDAPIPYEVLYQEIEKRWPGRWKETFDLDHQGVRFWDPKADNPAGCRVKPDGMQCFTGHVGFVKWEAIFGPQWMNAQRATNLGRAAGQTCFDGRTYWEPGVNGWIQIARDDKFLDLKCKKISIKPRKGQISSDAEDVLHHIQIHNRVEGAAPVVNRKPGIITLDGRRILNISTIKALEPAKVTGVTFDMIPAIYDAVSVLDIDGALPYFLLWLRRFYMSVLEYRPLLGQAIFLCGPKDSGKTLLVYRVIKPLVGDKATNPYDYFTGQTAFNAELFESPLLMINDEEGLGAMHMRLKFQARLKSFVVNRAHMYHRKFGTPFSVEWTGRLFATLNDDADSVSVLPEVNPNTRDKLMFFRAKSRPEGWEDSATLEPKIQAELPLFARFLLEYKMPEIRAGGRMGVPSYFDKKILEISRQQNAHYGMGELLTSWIKWDPYWSEDETRLEWQGDPTELMSRLMMLDQTAVVAKDLTQQRVSSQLDTLSRDPISGVTRIYGPTRKFHIDRKAIMTRHEAEGAGKSITADAALTVPKDAELNPTVNSIP